MDIDPDTVLACAKEDFDSVVDLARRLVRVPSRGGIDPYTPVLETMTARLDGHGLHPRTLRDATGAVVGLACEIRGGRPGPRWVLNACLDTAPFGDDHAWTHPPTDAAIVDGWLHGRGAADSKTGAAIFCHIAARLDAVAHGLRGAVTLLFDVDEHTGTFGGATTYFAGPDAPDDVAGVIIGYPGIDKLVVGGRGLLRAKLHVHGVASHSGGSKTSPNAIAKAADLIQRLSTAEPPKPGTPEFPLPGKITVTAVEGGHGYSLTPDLCVLNVDIRTTPAFDDTAATELLDRTTTAVDAAWPRTRPTLTQVETRWPAFALDDRSPLRHAVLTAADALHLDVAPKIAGPSNIGNYLAGLGIPALAGFGVDYTGLHATDERVRLDTIPAVQAVYHHAILRLAS